MAMIADALASQITETLAALAKDEVTMVLGAKEELRRLEKKVRHIRNFLQDAERRAFTKSAPDVRSWLAELKDILYDADDVIDYSRTKIEKLALLSSDEHQRSVCCYSPLLLSCFPRVALRHKIGSRVRSINERLERLIKDLSDLNLISNLIAPVDRVYRGIQRQTDPTLENDIVGAQIENDTAHLVHLCTSESAGGPVSVLAIIGMGGIGKTTLAQKVYNHDTIKKTFNMPPRAWVCVSQDYDSTNLLREVIKGFGGNPGDAQSKSELVVQLTDAIKGKKFFIVLDDVWSSQVWDDVLKKPLLKGAASSRVLITTRNDVVAKQMCAVHHQTVQVLSPEDGWSLLRKTVFPIGGDQEGIQVVGDLGMNIVEKCDGLPLALKTIAGVLRSKDCTRSEWEKVLRNPAWSLTDLPDGVMGVLYLSYEDLPFHLKQCFIFCSLFPEDFVFYRINLIMYWVAEGFIRKEGEGIMEEVALGYYEELLLRNLLQPDPQFYDNSACKVHDLLRSLAQFLAQDQNFIGDLKGLDNATSSSSSSSSVKLRHLSIVDEELNVVPEVVKQQESLRTLLLLYTPLVEDVPQDLFIKLGRIRVLDLCGTKVKRLPESVGNLIHLRFLDLTSSSIKELPETIGSLSNLQYLILRGCDNLKTLPRGIAKLYKLRSLVLVGTRVDGLPTGMGKLQHMNRLIGFEVNESIDGAGWCSLEELKSLSQLRSIRIENLERAVLISRPKPRGFLLKDKSHLQRLVLYWNHDEGQCSEENVDAKKIQEMFEEELFPPPSIKILEINGYLGMQFPNWMVSSNDLFNLRRLDLKKCPLCNRLPPLGQLPNLDYLDIEGAHAVEIIGAEFFFMMGLGSTATPPYCFPKLKKLFLENMTNLVDWQWEQGGGLMAMPHLETLVLFDCPKLRSLPGGLRQVTTLTYLRIHRTNSLTAVEGLVSIKEFDVVECPNLVRISNLPSLQTLEVADCSGLREVEGLHSLQSLTVDGEQTMESNKIHNWIQNKSHNKIHRRWRRRARGRVRTEWRPITC